MTLRNKKGLVLESKFDLVLLEKVEVLDLSWHLKWDNKAKSYYVKASQTFFGENNKRKQTTVHLHRLLTDAQGSHLFVDHINHDTLDNRISNLRITTKTQNSKNRANANSNNKSGYRNVSWSYNKWVVQLQVDGKGRVLGKFPADQLEEAAEYAEQMRREIYGEFAGK